MDRDPGVTQASLPWKAGDTQHRPWRRLPYSQGDPLPFQVGIKMALQLLPVAASASGREVPLPYQRGVLASPLQQRAFQRPAVLYDFRYCPGELDRKLCS